MLKKLVQKMVSDGIFYVRIRPHLLSVHAIGSSKTIEDMPIVALTKDDVPAIIAIGAAAETAAASSGGVYELKNGFDHPRSIISDFGIAEKTLQYFFHKLSNNKIFRPSPIVVMHPLEKNEGGLTEIEVRALRELALGAGARESYVWSGRELVDHEFESKRFPGDHWMMDKPKWVES